MVSDIHALVRDFLQQQTLEQGAAGDAYRKAGVIPYIRDDGLLFYVMKPRATRPDLGVPLFQLCKGTRMHHVPGVGWRDLRDSELGAHKETLAETALREGIEELGLKLENIKQLLDMGPYSFASATTGREKQMWLFAAEMKDTEDFLPDSQIATTTSARQWLDTAQFEVVGRGDHHYILRDIEQKLTRQHKE
jgi:hypothetical protein